MQRNWNWFKRVVVQFLGDAHKGEYFKNAILEKGYVPKVKGVGLRSINNFPGQFHERSWRMDIGKIIFQIKTEITVL